MFEFIGGFVCGAVGLVAYGAYRAVGSEGWDDSNVLNFVRLLSHCVMHPGDFAKMFYLLDWKGSALSPETVGKIGLEKALAAGYELRSPFPYLSKDEFSENFPDSRP